MKAATPKLPPRGDDSPSRPILSVAQALDYAADHLSRMAIEQTMVTTIVNAMKDRDTQFLKGLPSAVKTALIEPERQERSLRDAARIIRELAIEHTLLDLKELERLRSGDTGA